MNRGDATKARSLRKSGLPEQSILNHFGGKYTSPEIDALITELRQWQAQYRKKYYKSAPATLWRGIEERVVADPASLAERDKRLARNPVSLTAALCGDPLPGYSALDNR